MPRIILPHEPMPVRKHQNLNLKNYEKKEGTTPKLSSKKPPYNA